MWVRNSERMFEVEAGSALAARLLAEGYTQVEFPGASEPGEDVERKLLEAMARNGEDRPVRRGRRR